jgi:hypothetical protein
MCFLIKAPTAAAAGGIMVHTRINVEILWSKMLQTLFNAARVDQIDWGYLCMMSSPAFLFLLLILQTYCLDHTFG